MKTRKNRFLSKGLNSKFPFFQTRPKEELLLKDKGFSDTIMLGSTDSINSKKVLKLQQGKIIQTVQLSKILWSKKTLPWSSSIAYISQRPILANFNIRIGHLILVAQIILIQFPARIPQKRAKCFIIPYFIFRCFYCRHAGWRVLFIIVNFSAIV
jgi:hypothetical protein